MKEKALKLLGLMRRANAIQPGEDRAGDAVQAGRAKLLLLASDAADNARRRAEHLVNGWRAQLVELPFDRAELGEALGLGGCSMAAVTDLGFAGALTELLAGIDPERYAELAAETDRRRSKAQRRKKETEALKRNERNGKRRTNG